MSELLPPSAQSSPATASDGASAKDAHTTPPATGMHALFSLSPRGIIGFALTSLLSGALLLILLVRLIAAGQTVAAVAPYPLVGHPAPDFTVSIWNGQTGQTIHLAALKGKPVVVNFWASWCDSCTQELPTLESAYRQYAQKGVVFVGLAYNDTAANGKPFLQKYGVTYPSGPDASGEISVAYGVTGVPETVFIGSDGKIVSKIPSAVDDQSLANGLAGIVT